MSEYMVIYEQNEEGAWGAYLPDLPGVVALGDSKVEVARNIQKALSAYAGEMRSLGREMPEPVHDFGRVAV